MKHLKKQQPGGSLHKPAKDKFRHWSVDGTASRSKDKGAVTASMPSEYARARSDPGPAYDPSSPEGLPPASENITVSDQSYIPLRVYAEC